MDMTFSRLSDDVILKILFLLEDDPRIWARLSCVSIKFSSLIPTVCCKSKCISNLPSLSLPSHGGAAAWASLYKIAVCCPGLHHSGLLLDHSDFGLLRDLGPHEAYQTHHPDPRPNQGQDDNTVLSDPVVLQGQTSTGGVEVETWTLDDDLYSDSLYDNSESTAPADPGSAGAVDFVITNDDETKRRKTSSSTSASSSSSSNRLVRSHLASGIWNLSREQGNKLLASRFRDDCLYISEWPGCIHMEEKRNYMVFRGLFKNFKRSKVWRTIKEGQKGQIELNCAYCECKYTWDLHSAFCLKRGFGFHDDGEPVVRAYVCDNGHVSGAWTDLPLYG